MTRRAARAAAAMLCAVLASAPAARAEDERGDDLRELRDAIAESRDRVERFEREERALFDALDEIEQRLAGLGDAERNARRAAEEAKAAVAGARERARVAAERLEATRGAMSRRVVALYKSGEVGPVRALFSSGSLQEMLTREAALRAVVEVDAELVRRYRRDRDAEVAARHAAEQAAVHRDRALEELADARVALAAERQVRRELLARVHEDRGQERALLIGLERAARALEETLTRLGDAASEGGFDGSGFAERKGRLRSPVAAPIVERFGRVVDAEFKTQTFRKGVDFGAASGDSVHAVAPGRVRFAGWFRGYGNIVILDHGDGYFTVSGHLREIFVAVGDRVAEGDTLGAAGATGSLEGPRLYFELRAGSEPVDPADWLRAG